MKEKNAKQPKAPENDSTQSMTKDYSLILKLDFRAIVVFSLLLIFLVDRAEALEDFVNAIKTLVNLAS